MSLSLRQHLHYTLCQTEREDKKVQKRSTMIVLKNLARSSLYDQKMDPAQMNSVSTVTMDVFLLKFLATMAFMAAVSTHTIHHTTTIPNDSNNMMGSRFSIGYHIRHLNGDASSDLSLILDLHARELARKFTPFYKCY